MELLIKLEPKKLLLVFGGISCLLTLLHLAIGLIRRLLNHPLLDASWIIFDVGADSSIPTWYSSLMLFTCSLFLIFIGWIKLKENDKYGRKWITLSVIFLLMSIDEVARIHETLGDTFGKLVQVSDSTGFLHYEWVVLGLLGVVSVALYCFPLVFTLPREIKTLFIVSAIIFVGGGLGIEMINGRTEYFYGARNTVYALGTVFEESFEMAGVSLFIYALSLHIKKYIGIRLVNINLIA